MIPKQHQPGKWRLIVDLSHPKGASMNDGIEADLCSLSYVSIDDAACFSDPPERKGDGPG